MIVSLFILKPIIGSGTSSCFYHRLKGRKLPNKEDLTVAEGWAPWVSGVSRKPFRAFI